MGGPVMLPKLYCGKDRSFFFVTFEQTHAEEQTSTAFRTLPTASSRTATSRVSSMPGTRAMPARARS